MSNWLAVPTRSARCRQTLSVALQRIAPDTPLNLLLAALFLLFQRHIVAGLTTGGSGG